MIDRETLAVYAARAADYRAMIKRSSPDPDLVSFIDALPEGAHVLDLGCGPGNAALAMAEVGHSVVAMDASPEMVADLSHERIKIRIADFDAVTETAAYDAIWANFSLLHAPKSEMPRHLAAVRRALRDGGLFHIGLKTGDGERRDEIGRMYAYYTEAEIEDLLSEAGFAIHRRRTGSEPGLSGVEAPWITMQARTI